LFQAGFNVGSAGGAMALGELAERAGYPVVFWVAGGCVLIALGLVIVSPEGRARA